MYIRTHLQTSPQLASHRKGSSLRSCSCFCMDSSSAKQACPNTLCEASEALEQTSNSYHLQSQSKTHNKQTGGQQRTPGTNKPPSIIFSRLRDGNKHQATERGTGTNERSLVHPVQSQSIRQKTGRQQPTPGTSEKRLKTTTMLL